MCSTSSLSILLSGEPAGDRFSALQITLYEENHVLKLYLSGKCGLQILTLIL